MHHAEGPAVRLPALNAAAQRVFYQRKVHHSYSWHPDLCWHTSLTWLTWDSRSTALGNKELQPFHSFQTCITKQPTAQMWSVQTKVTDVKRSNRCEAFKQVWQMWSIQTDVKRSNRSHFVASVLLVPQLWPNANSKSVIERSCLLWIASKSACGEWRKIWQNARPLRMCCIPQPTSNTKAGFVCVLAKETWANHSTQKIKK